MMHGTMNLKKNSSYCWSFNIFHACSRFSCLFGLLETNCNRYSTVIGNDGRWREASRIV